MPMKAFQRHTLILFILIILAGLASAQTTFTLDPLSSFGGRGDGSIQPGDVIGINPKSGNTVAISAVLTAGVAYGV